MYPKESMQLSLIDEFYLPFGGKLCPDNRWVILSEMIPWSEFEDDYAENFKPTGRKTRRYSG